jgi:hypothetical protein
MTTAFIASTQPPNPKMPTDTEPANAALPTLDPQAQELARLKALVATQAEEILYVGVPGVTGADIMTLSH